MFLCAGMAIWLEVSFLLSGIIAGAIIVNFAQPIPVPFTRTKTSNGRS